MLGDPAAVPLLFDNDRTKAHAVSLRGQTKAGQGTET
jgi:hypothetical protein